MDGRVLFALIPISFALFAVALGLLSVLDRRSTAAHWGASAFALASVGVTLDALRPPGATWGLLFIHILVVTAFAKALAARHRRPLPVSLIALLALTAIAITALGLAKAPLELRQLAFNIGLLLAMGELARRCWGWNHRQTVDRIVVWTVAGLAASYAARLAYLAFEPLSDTLSTQGSFFAIVPNLVFHVIMGVSGCAAGLMLLLVLGWDHVVNQASKLMTDPLTSVGNRYALAEALKSERLGEWECCGAIVLDLDHFKMINDRFGHGGGDQILSCVGIALIRAVGCGIRLFRVGGEEFVLLVERDHGDRIAAIAQRAREAVASARCWRQGETVRATASIGWHLRSQGESIEEAIECADQAMYIAKASGRDQVVCFQSLKSSEVKLALVS